MAPFVAVGEYEKFAMGDDAYEGPIDLIVETENRQQVLSQLFSTQQCQGHVRVQEKYGRWHSGLP